MVAPPLTTLDHDVGPYRKDVAKRREQDLSERRPPCRLGAGPITELNCLCVPFNRKIAVEIGKLQNCALSALRARRWRPSLASEADDTLTPVDLDERLQSSPDAQHWPARAPYVAGASRAWGLGPSLWPAAPMMPSLRPISLAGRGPNWEGFERELHLGLMIYILICQLNINCRSIWENYIILHYFNLFLRPSQITLARKDSSLPGQSCSQNSFLNLRDGCRAYPNVLRISSFCYPTVTPSERTSPAVLATGLYF